MQHDCYYVFNKLNQAVTHRMKKTIAFALSAICLGLVVAYFIGLYPFFIFDKNTTSQASIVAIKDENKPFQQFNFQEGNYTAYVIISVTDLMNSWAGIPRNRVLKSSDKQILSQLKNCEFIRNGSDSLKIESRIYLLKNDSLIYQSGLVLDQDFEGIHNNDSGWAESKQKGQLLRILRQFEAETKPVVFLQ